MKVSIVSTPKSGKTTFFGLLYQSMERYANEKPDSFSFYMPPKTTEACIKKIRNPLQQGEFPKPIDGRLKFLIDISPPKKGLKKIGSTLKKNFLPSKKNKNSSSKITLNLFNISKNGERDKFFKNILDSDVLVVVIDSSKFPQDNEEKKLEKAHKYDKEVKTVISRFLEKGIHRKDDRIVDLIFIFTRLDRFDNQTLDDIEEKKWRELLDVEEPYKEDDVKKTSEKILKKFLPDTWRVLEDHQKSYTALREVKYFFSWLELVEDETKGRKLKVELNKTGDNEFFSNIYPVNHHKKFINYLGILNNRYYDGKR